MNTTLTRTSSIIGVIIVLSLLFLVMLAGSPSFLSLFNLSKINETSFFISRILIWICLVITWLYAFKIEKQNLLLWKDKQYKLGEYLGSIIIILIIVFVGIIFVGSLLFLMGFKNNTDKMKDLVSIFHSNKLLLIFTPITAGIVEELIFRGYLMPRLEYIFKNPYIAIISSSILFGLMHFAYGNIFQIVGPIFIGLIFGFYYWKYRNIKVLIICHLLWDLLVLLLLLKKY